MRARGRAAGRALAGRRGPQSARRRGWRWPPSGAGVPAGERSRQAPGRGTWVALEPGAPGTLGSPRGNCRRVLRTESGVRRGLERWAQAAGPGGGGVGSLTGRRRRAGGRRQLLQEAHGHFQDVRFLQFRVAGALCQATKERDRETHKQDRPPAGCREHRAPRSWVLRAARPAGGGLPEPCAPRIGHLSAPGARGSPPARSPRPAPRDPLHPAPVRPAGPRGPSTHLPAQQRQDEPLELAQALVDARAAPLLQQRLQALQAGV